MFKLIKRLVLLIVFLLIGVVVLIGIWWYRPYSSMEMRKVTGENTLIQADIPSDSGNPIRGLLVDIAEERVFKDIPDGWKKSIGKRLLHIAFPQRIKLFAYPHPSAENPSYVIAMDFGRASHLTQYAQKRASARIFQNASYQESNIQKYTLLKRTKPAPGRSINALSWVDSGLIAGTNVEDVQKTVESYIKNSSSGNLSSEEAVINIDNNSAFLTDKIRLYEKKLEYDIFSSIDRVETVTVNLKPKDSDTLAGTIRFQGKNDLKDDDPMISDADFFFSVLRRLLKPRGIELTGQQTYSGNQVELTVELKGFKTAISQIDTLTQEGSNK